MNLKVELPQELQDELSSEAKQLGLTLSEYVLRLLLTGRHVATNPKTGAELVDYWQSEGLIGSRSDIADSQEHARRLRNNAERRNET